jgi:methionyl-tRNA formyltransferase
MEFSEGIIYLSTDTPHHRYLIKSFEKEKIFFDKIFFETTSIKPKFKIEQFEKKKINKFEKKFFFKFSNQVEKKNIRLVKNINSKIVYNYIKKKKPKICIVFGTRKIDKKIINLFQKKFIINIHRGIMSKYRGLDSDLWAILENRLDHVGITIHEVKEKLDSGRTFYEKKLNLKNKKIFQLRYFTTVMAVKYLLILIKKIIKKKKIKMKQLRLGKYYSFMPLILKNKCKQILENA